MERRRTSVKRPPTSEEIQCWEQAAASMVKLSQLHNPAVTSEKITRVNKLLASIPSDEAIQNGEGPTKIDISSALIDLKTSSEAESKAIAHLLEELGILIALRQAPEQGLVLEKRAKRMRTSPPSSSIPGTPNGISTPPHSHHAPTRSSQGPVPHSKYRSPYASQFPLQIGRKVAFKVPQTDDKGGKTVPGEAADGESASWIMAVVRRCISAEKNKYEVQDVDDSEGTGMTYTATLRSMIPLPDPTAHPSHPSHPSQYKEHPRGSLVLGLYPDTTAFYRAEVIGVPKDPQPSGTRTAPSSKNTPMYKLRFEDDDNQIRSVPGEFVVQCVD